MQKRTRRLLVILLAVLILGTAAFLTVNNIAYWQRLLALRREAASRGAVDLSISAQPALSVASAVRQAVYVPGEGVYVAVSTGASYPLSLDVAAGDAPCEPARVTETLGLTRKLVEAFFPLDLDAASDPIFLRFWETGLDAQDQLVSIRIDSILLEYS